MAGRCPGSPARTRSPGCRACRTPGGPPSRSRASRSTPACRTARARASAPRPCGTARSCSVPITRAWRPARCTSTRWPTPATSPPTPSTSPKPSPPSTRRPAPSSTGPTTWSRSAATIRSRCRCCGAPYTHGTPFRRAVEEGLLALDSSAHVGIRGPLYDAADLTDDKALGFATVTTADVARGGVDQAIDRIRERVGDRPVYLSVDIDVLDPAHAPGTGTPEPGGLTTRELQLILRGLTGLNLAGADVVEVAPAYDHAELTALAAANVAYEFLGLFARQAGT